MKKTIFSLFIIAIASTQLTACGFHLRGYSNPMSVTVPQTAIIVGGSPEDFIVKNELKQQLKQLGVKIATDTTAQSSIKVSNLQLQNYQLRGTLTEIRMILSADVSYQIVKNGKSETITNNIQVQRSYQYDQATLATDNLQAEKIKTWLYENLAERIADQYMALSLPKVSADQVKP